MTEKTLKSGAKLGMTLADFTDAMALLHASQKSESITSPEVLNALWPCLIRCVRNNQKISVDLFMDEKNREDFLEIAEEVMKFNIAPFFKNRARQ